MIRGWLSKKGPQGKITKWRKRYFVLSRHTKKLNYYEDSDCQTRVGTADLMRAVRASELNKGDIPGYGMEILSHDRVWHLCTEEEDDRQEWLTALRRVVPEFTPMRGWLHSQTLQPIPTFKKRFFVLHQNGLPCFEDEDCENFVEGLSFQSAVAVAPIPVDQAEHKTGSGLQIVVQGTGKVHSFYAETEKQRDRWVRYLTRYIPRLTTETTPLHSGYLTKRGDLVKNWKNRFFVLLEGLLLYFKDEASWKLFLKEEQDRQEGRQAKNFVSKAPSGVVPLRGAEVLLDGTEDDTSTTVKKMFSKGAVDDDSHTFAIKTRKRTFYLRAPNDSARHGWINAINRTLFFAPFQSSLLHNPNTAFAPEEEDDEADQTESAATAAPLRTLSSLQSSGNLSGMTAQELQAIRPLPMFFDVWKQKTRETLTHPLLAQYFCRYFAEYWLGEVRQKHPNGASLEIDHSYLTFWLQAEEYSVMKPSVYRRNLAVEIYQRFFAHGADQKIHVQTKLQLALAEHFANPFQVNYKFTNALFRPAQDQVLEIFAADVFPYFVLSKSPCGIMSALRAVRTDDELVDRIRQTFANVQRTAESKTDSPTALPVDGEATEVMRRAPPSFIKFLRARNKGSARNYRQHRMSFFGAANTTTRPRSDTGTPATQHFVKGVIEFDEAHVGLAMLSLWKELDEMRGLPRQFIPMRAYAIYEEYICLCATRLVRVSEELLNDVIQSLVKPDKFTFTSLFAVVDAYLRERYVDVFLQEASAGWNQGVVHHPMRPTGATVPEWPVIVTDRKFNKWLASKKLSKYLNCWRDMEDFRLHPFQKTDADRWTMKRRSEVVFSEYFSATCAEDREINVETLKLERESVLNMFAIPHHQMFKVLQEKLALHIRDVLYSNYLAAGDLSCGIIEEEDDADEYSGHSECDQPPDITVEIDDDGDVVPPPPEDDPPPPPSPPPPPPPSSDPGDMAGTPPPPSSSAPPSEHAGDADDEPLPPPQSTTGSASVGGLPPMPETKNSGLPPMPGSKSPASSASSGGGLPPMPGQSSALPAMPSTSSGLPPMPGHAASSSTSSSSAKSLNVSTKPAEDELDVLDADGRLIVPFSIVVGDPKLSRHFKHYMSRSTAAGSLMLYFLIEEYASLPMGILVGSTNSAAAFRESIYNNFLANNAPVKIPCVVDKIRRSIRRDLSGTPRPYTFQPAQQAIYEFLKGVFYKPFRRSHYYELVLQEYENEVKPRQLKGVTSYWTPALRADPRGLHNLSCGNACWAMFFELFLKKQFATENYYFFIEVDDFRYYQGHNYRQILARRVFEKFISHSSDLQVNIPAVMYRDVLARFDLCPPDLFHRSQQEIYTLMQKDSIPRFVQSDEFTAYRKQLPSLPSPTSASNMVKETP